MNDEIQMIPMDQIRILNPRHRDRKKFEMILESIRTLGLKKPIQVSLRSASEGEGPGYDLVCGQGRMEAFTALGHKHIPAVVVEISKEDRLLRSLAENMARRSPSPMELTHEIERLKARGNSQNEIARKLGVDPGTIAGLLALKKAGELRLLEATLSGTVPLHVAMEIAKADSAEMQRALLKAYEKKQLTHFSIRVVKRLIDRRRFYGKHSGRGKRSKAKPRTSADSLVNAYRRESQKQKLMLRKARVCDAKLLFVVTAFRKLMADENLVNLLRAEGLAKLPKTLWSRVAPANQKAA